MSLTRSNAGGPIRDSVYVRTEALKSELLKSETLGRCDRFFTIVNISKYKEKSEKRPSVAI